MTHVTPEVIHEAEAGLEVQRLVEGLRAGTLRSDAAWLAFIELAARHGWKSAACRTLVVRLAKTLGQND